MFFGCAVLYALRGNISFALVCMVNANSTDTHSGDISIASNAKSKCDSQSEFLALFKPANDSSSEKFPVGEFNWSKQIQGAILSAFFFGYMASQILGGYLAQKIGPKRVVGVAILLCSLLTLVNPAAARYDVALLIVMRTLLGFLQGVIFPAMHSMWALWSPPLERGLLTGLSYAGSQIGNVLVMPLSGILCRHGFGGGWPSIFYVIGVAGMLWCIAWKFLVADTPQKHRRISDDERHYIICTLNTTNDNDTRYVDKDMDEKSQNIKVAKVKLPLRAILTSPAVWACFVGHFAGDWGAYTMATGLPLFINDALGLDPATMGMLSSLPYIAYFIMINIGGYIADHVQESGMLSTLNTRRLAMIVALGGQALFLILIGKLECGQEQWLVLLLTLSLGVSGLQYSGFIVNYLDICPAFAGTLVGIGQTISCLGGIISPLAIGFLTPTNSREEWQNVFYLTAVVLVAGALFFSAFASGTVQQWAEPYSLVASSATDESVVESDEKAAPKTNEKTVGDFFSSNLSNVLNEPLLDKADSGAAKK